MSTLQCHIVISYFSAVFTRKPRVGFYLITISHGCLFLELAESRRDGALWLKKSTPAGLICPDLQSSQGQKTLMCGTV